MNESATKAAYLRVQLASSSTMLAASAKSKCRHLKVEYKEETRTMRAILLAVVTAAGIGLAGTAGVSAAPINGAAIGSAANETSSIEHVQHWRWGSGGRRWGGGGGHWRWGSRGVRRCHRPYSSRWRPCW